MSNGKDKIRPEWSGNLSVSPYFTHNMKKEHDGMIVSENVQSNKQNPILRRKQLAIDDYVQGVINGDRAIIAQAITLVESNLPKHIEMAQQVLKQLIPYTGNSIRVGFTGVPGAGKSTLIESFGMILCEKNHRVAVLAVDPSSSVSKGSILGDKTRMEQLSRHPHAYVRPSPSSGTLGGVTRKSRETLLIFEAAGYDVIVVETIGVGQSEIAVRSMVDFFLVIMLTGAGDELQGMKKGVMELADAIFINKADGENRQAALNVKVEYNRLLHFLQPATEGWETKAFAVSALTGAGLDEIWSIIELFHKKTNESGIFNKRRQKQTLDWLHYMVEEYLRVKFYIHPKITKDLPQIEQAVVEGTLSATMAAKELLKNVEY
ncbi:methylmalonyl Co-A mutase-associated GTPase MeaB [Peribacillus sp. NPDC006672]|uniref:methylmalonyl Co-A mutase-associated GTPase MeaB n=1 Tax=Peribacillus sp. NPDC006672 TaxID=3390606 RepID=UPI003D07640F